MKIYLKYWIYVAVCLLLIETWSYVGIVDRSIFSDASCFKLLSSQHASRDSSWKDLSNSLQPKLFKKDFEQEFFVRLSKLSILMMTASSKSVADTIDDTTGDDNARILTRDDVGLINLNDSFPQISDVCWLDIQIGDAPPQRIEISLFGDLLNH